MPIDCVADQMIQAARQLSAAVERLRFKPPVTHVYNPLDYAWRAHEAYLRRFGRSRKRVLFLGMNPGPFGMAQTGVPFGEINAVRDWMNIQAPIDKPARDLNRAGPGDLRAPYRCIDHPRVGVVTRYAWSRQPSFTENSRCCRSYGRNQPQQERGNNG